MAEIRAILSNLVSIFYYFITAVQAYFIHEEEYTIVDRHCARVYLLGVK
jgi:hypothetical protein